MLDIKRWNRSRRLEDGGSVQVIAIDTSLSRTSPVMSGAHNATAMGIALFAPYGLSEWWHKHQDVR
jgi:hypothetical protein